MYQQELSVGKLNSSHTLLPKYSIYGSFDAPSHNLTKDGEGKSHPSKQRLLRHFDFNVAP